MSISSQHSGQTHSYLEFKINNKNKKEPKKSGTRKIARSSIVRLEFLQHSHDVANYGTDFDTTMNQRMLREYCDKLQHFLTC